MNLLSQISNALADLKTKKIVAETTEARIVGVVRIDFVSEQFYVEAINEDRFYITPQYSEFLVEYEVFFEKPIVECRVSKSNRLNSYNSPKFAGTVIENTITVC